MDLLVGDSIDSPLNRVGAGTAYVIYGQPGQFQSLQQKSDLNNDGIVNHLDLFLFGEQWHK